MLLRAPVLELLLWALLLVWLLPRRRAENHILLLLRLLGGHALPYVLYKSLTVTF
jgi:hypothetical protein